MYTEPLGHVKFEKQLMVMLLDGKDPVLEELRVQYLNSTVVNRDFTGVGFFTEFSINHTVQPLSGIKRLVFGDVRADYDNIKGCLGFLIFLDNGYLSTLEGYTVMHHWPDDYSNIHLYYLSKVDNKYQPGDKCNLDTLKKNWFLPK